MAEQELEMPKTYVIGEKHYPLHPWVGGHRYIQCLVCGMRSFNPNDIEQKYCGNCHQFHEVMMRERNT